MKKLAVISLVLLVALVIAGWWVYREVGREGSGPLEGWIGSQLQQIANGHLHPKLSFDDLDYQAPGTVSLQHLRLVADDPGNPGKTVDILGCQSATVTLAEIPQVGKPIVIEKIVLDRPLISAVAVGPESNQFIGFSNLVRHGPESQPAPQGAAPTTRPKLSDVFRIRLIKINGGKIMYDPRIAGTAPMVLDQVNTTLDVEPTETAWYAINTDIDREGLFNISVDGQVNLDSFSAREMAVKLMANLTQDKLDYLPPALQKKLKQHEVRGALEVSVNGSMPIMQPLQGDMTADLKLSDANVTFGRYRIPVEDLNLSAAMQKGRLDLSQLKIAALGGAADASGSAQLTGLLDSDIKLRIAGMQLKELLASREDGKPPLFAGVVNADAQAHAPLKLVMDKTSSSSPTQPQAQTASEAQLPENWGTASLHLTEARLIHLSVVGDLRNTIARTAKLLLPGDGEAKSNETADAEIVFSGDEIQFTQLKYIGDVVAARGKGSMTLDRRLDLTLSAGPVEKVQSLLGEKLGGAIGAVTDKLLSYRVTGTADDPKIDVQVAGGAVGNVGNAIQGGAGAIGEGLKNLGRGIGNIANPDQKED